MRCCKSPRFYCWPRRRCTITRAFKPCRWRRAFTPTWVRKAQPAGLVTGNVTAIIGDEAVLVVDSGHFPSSARKMIAHLKSVTSKPVKFLVNTHWHQDHVMGNVAFQREWPEVEILAHPFTAKELAKPENGQAYAENLQKQLPGAIEQVRGILLSGKLPNGNALTHAQQETFEEMVTAFTVSIREAPEMEFVPATRMVELDTEISLGQRKVQMRFLGEGNTEGDLIVYVPDAKVLLTGDMVVYPTPFALDAHLAIWAGTMEKLMAIEATKIVPGHGPPMEDKTYLNDVRPVADEHGRTDSHTSGGRYSQKPSGRKD